MVLWDSLKIKANYEVSDTVNFKFPQKLNH